MQNFTPEQLTQYLYGEALPTEASAMSEALKNNWTISEKYRVLAEAAACLNEAQYSPRPQAVAAVLAYAEKKLQLTPHLN
ncbi:MAG TPA: hypothetical protein PKD90_04840 [Phnomibacter sp.]|nr:hypothetical protein [Phnomibacter sp.]